MPGHPDGQNYAIWRGPNFIATGVAPLSSASPINAQGQVTNYASVMLNFAGAPVAGADVVVNFYTDSTLSRELTFFEWTVPPGADLHVLMPAIGNFVTLSIQTTNIAQQLCPVSMYPTNTPATRLEYPVVGNVNGNLNENIALNSSIIHTLPFIAAGKGHVHFSDVTASGKLSYQVVTLDHNGARDKILVSGNAPVTSVGTDFAAPDRALGISVNNADLAAVHAAEWSLHVDSK